MAKKRREKWKAIGGGRGGEKWMINVKKWGFMKETELKNEKEIFRLKSKDK